MLFLFFFTRIPAQNNDQPDSAVGVADSLQTTIEGNGDTAVINNSVYFLNKALQVSGGGPDSLAIRKLPDSIVTNLLRDDNFWYVNYLFEKEKKQEEKESESFTQSTGFQTILWLIIIGGFAAFVIIYLANSNVGLFRKKSKSIAANEDDGTDTGNIFGINYQREIDKAVNIGNYRLAVRLMFLRVLKNLSDKKVIQYKQDRTNFDYLMQLHSTKYYGDFFRLTRNYEYSWYGQFAIEPEKFTVIKKDFETFDRNLNYR